VKKVLSLVATSGLLVMSLFAEKDCKDTILNNSAGTDTNDNNYSNLYVLSVSDDYELSRTTGDHTSLNWVIFKDGVQVLSRNALNELNYTYFANYSGSKYCAYISSFIDGSYRKVSNMVEYEVGKKPIVYNFDNTLKNTKDEANNVANSESILYESENLTGISNAKLINNKVVVGFGELGTPKSGYPTEQKWYSLYMISGNNKIIIDDSTNATNANGLSISSYNGNIFVAYQKPTGFSYGFDSPFKIYSSDGDLITDEKIFSNANWGCCTSIDIDSLGNTHVIQFAHSGYFLNYSTNSSESWINYNISGYSTYYHYPKLTIDRNDVPNIITSQLNASYGTKGKMELWTNKNGNWSKETIATDSNGHGKLVFDNENNIYGVYVDTNDNIKLIFKDDSNNWISEIIASGLDIKGKETRVAISNDNKLYVVAKNNNGDKMYLFLKNNNGWETKILNDNLTPTTNDNSKAPSILFDTENNLIVIYADDTKIYKYLYRTNPTCKESEKIVNGTCIEKTCQTDNFGCPTCTIYETLKYNADGSGYCEISSCEEGKKLINGICVDDNTPPIVTNQSIEVESGKTYNFTKADFENSFLDNDGDGLKKIKITSLPINGVLKLNNNTISLNQEIDLAELGNLSYVANSVLINTVDSFQSQAFDGVDWSNSASTNIFITSIKCDISNAQAKILPGDGCEFKDKYSVGEDLIFTFKYNEDGEILTLPTKNSCKVSNSDIFTYSKSKKQIIFEEDGIGMLTCVYNNIVVRETLKVGNIETYPNNAIIVVGKGSNSDRLKSAFNYLGNSVYQFLYSQGYSNDEIDYFNAFGEQEIVDIDLDGEKDNIVDKILFSFEDVKMAINNAPASKNPLLIYLIDHGVKGGGFVIDDSEKIYAAQLNQVLNDYQATTERKVILIVDSCYSGAFVDLIKGENRVVISSGLANELVQISTSGISFTNYFIKNLSDKRSLKESYNKASQTYTNIVKNSHPQASFGDDELANAPFGFLHNASADVIKDFTKDLTNLKIGTQRLTLTTTDNLIDKPNAKAFVTITPPQIVEIDPKNDTDAIEILSFKLPLTYSGDNFYTDYSFKKEGVYQIQYEISDIAGDKYISDSTTIQVGDSKDGIIYETIKSSVLTEQEDDNTIKVTHTIDQLLLSKSYTKTGTFTNYDFLGVDKAFDWAFVTNSGAVYQLQGKSPTKSDVFGWKKVDIKPTITSSSWNMIFLDDWDSDGVTKFDWVLYKNENKTDQIYKLGGVSDSGNFVYEKIDGLKALIDKNSVRFEKSF